MMRKITVLFLVCAMIAAGTIACMVAHERMEQTAFELRLDKVEGMQE
jgi:hypothetical protein